MKQKLVKLVLVLVAIAGVFILKGCNHEPQGFVGAKGALNQKVNYKLAEECVQLYKTTPLSKISYKTTKVVFDKDSLRNWIDSLDKVTTYDKMEVRFGIYNSGILRGRKDSALKINKLTVFFFPTLKGEAAKTGSKRDSTNIDPFNLGEVHDK